MENRQKMDISGHGLRTEAFQSTSPDFRCHVCSKKISRGHWVVGFENDNKRRSDNFDHVCAWRCADEYKVPELLAKATCSAQPETQAVTRALQKHRGPSPPACESTPKEKVAVSFMIASQEAERVLREDDGDPIAALTAIALQWVRDTCM